MWCKADIILQDLVLIIFNEGRKDELIRVCDLYHFGFESIDAAIEWGINFGEFIGHFHFGSHVWEFKFPGERGAVYFIGTREETRKKIYEIL
jgi:hypothetical protein